MSKSRHRNNITFDPNKIKYYYGIPHCHCSYSTGKGNPLEIYTAAIKCGLDFLFLTDHNDFLITKTKYKDDLITKWELSTIITTKACKNSSNFIPILGFECKSVYGDLNIINPNSFFTGTVSDIRLLTLWMLNNNNSFISINHPHKNILNLQYNTILNKLITSIEVCNGNPASKYTRHDKYYFALLDRGWKLSSINGQDNHRINFADSEYLTAYIGNELSRNSLIDAFRNHRTYSTESKFLKFHFLLNNTFMGDTLFITSNKLKFSIFVEDVKYRILHIQIISNNGTIIKSIENINLNYIRYFYEHIHEKNETWYVIRVMQENNKIALSSPIFIEDSLIKNKNWTTEN